MGLRLFCLGHSSAGEIFSNRRDRVGGQEYRMQRPRNAEALQGMDGYEQMVNTFAENAKAYWRLWGPQGEPMIRVAARAMGRNLSGPTIP